MSINCEDHNWYSKDDGVSACYLCGVDTVNVPVTGEYFVRDGKVIEIIESELMEPGTENWAWRVWTDPQEDDDE